MIHLLKSNGKLIRMLSVLLAGCFFGTANSFGDETDTQELLEIELFDDGVTFELSKSANCKYTDVVGIVSKEEFSSLWSRLTDDADVLTLDEADIKTEIRQEVKTTGLVGNIDPAQVTRLTLRFQDKQKTISLYNVAATNKMYPRAEKLARYNLARLALRELREKCQPELRAP